MNFQDTDTVETYNAIKEEGAKPELMGANSLIGKEVYNYKGEHLGNIKEVMLDIRNGKVAYPVLSFGGILGLGDKLLAVPWFGLTFDNENKRFFLDIEKSKLIDAPGFDNNHWPDRADASLAGNMKAPDNESYNVTDDGSMREVLGVNTLIGSEVYNHKAEHLGNIKEVMVDMRNGNVAYAALGFGGLLGLGEKLFAVPWFALKLDASQNRFILAIKKQELAEAPGFDNNHWPVMADVSWSNNINQYYGIQRTDETTGEPV